MWVRIPPPVPTTNQSKVQRLKSKVQSQGAGFRNGTLDLRLFVISGDEREMESGLTFNQLICEFESRHPRQDIFDFQLPIANWPLARFEAIGNPQCFCGP